MTDTCSTSLQTKTSALELKMESSASEIGYISRDTDQIFACTPLAIDLTKGVDYRVTIINEDTKAYGTELSSNGAIKMI